jgi:hypothetical protein
MLFTFKYFTTSVSFGVDTPLSIDNNYPSIVFKSVYFKLGYVTSRSQILQENLLWQEEEEEEEGSCSDFHGNIFK